MDRIARVFVSSTWLDLQPEREAVEKALQRMKQTKLNGMEYFGSRDENTRDVSLAEVDRSDVYVGIIGGRYGSGITEEEYQRASEKRLPRFIYFKDEQTISPDGRDAERENQTKLATWKTELRKAHALDTGPFTSPDDLATRVTADLSNWLLEQCATQVLLNGVGSLLYDYAPRIENFLTEYLGTSTAPVPFGGREQDLKALDDWLEDNTAPPYLVMAAPAGRGKSALLVRWTSQLLARPHISLVFVPISIRFRTNLSTITFATLAARLATLHGEKVPETPSTTVEVWRGLVTDYLRRPLPSGETLVVVLDGLDEAADWEPGPDLFPLTPPDHMRIVVSARYRTGDIDASDWFRRLGWERKGLARSIDLRTLTKDGVARVLESMGFPLAQLGAKVDIVSELYRLTEGDPLLLKLYVEDLWSRKETVGLLMPEDLRKLKPGLNGYFDRWWDDQRKLWGKESPLKEQNVQTLLSALACSLGPLDQEGLLRLTKLSSWDLREALKPLDRFIIGDGKVHGYAFSHPHLGDYLKDALSASEQETWQQRFLRWGKETVQALEDGSLAPAKAPAYIVQYYGAHLERAHAQAEAMLTLVCQGWSKAWEALEGSFAGFLNDVERAWKAAECENKKAIKRGVTPPRIGDEIRCALVRASINSLASNLPVKLIVLLVKYQKWTFRLGLVYAQQIPDSYHRDDALLSLITALATCDNTREQVLVEALTAARAIEDSTTRAQALTALAPYQPESVLAVAHTIENSRDRVRVLTALLPHMAEPVRQSLLEEALTTTRTIESSTSRAQALTALAPYQPEAVLAVAHTIENSRDRVRVLTALLPYMAEPVRQSLLKEALTAARTIENSESRAQVLTALVPHVAESVRQSVLEEALTAARVLRHSWRRADVLVALAPYQPEAVLDIARTLNDSESRAQVLTALLPQVTEPVRESLIEEAYTAARTIENRESCAQVLTALLPHMAEPVRQSLLKEALTAARTIEDSESCAQVLTVVLPHVAESVRQSVLEEALTAARIIKDSESHVQVLIALVPHMAESVRQSVLEEALTAARIIEDSESHVQALIALVPHVAESVRQSVLEEALIAARTIQNSCRGVDVLTALAPYQPEAVLATSRALDDSWRRADVLVALAPYQPESVLAVAHTIENSRDRVRVLTALLPHMAEPVRQSVLEEALTAARIIGSPWHRANILTALLLHVTESVRRLLLEEALIAARAIEDSEFRAQALTALVPHTIEPIQRSLVDEALTAACTIKDSWRRSDILVALAPYQPEAILAAFDTIEASVPRTQVLFALLTHLPDAVYYHLYVEWCITLSLSSLGIRRKLMTDLSALVSTIEELGKAQALEGTLHAVRDVTTWWP